MTTQAASGRPIELGLRPEHVRPGEAREPGDVAIDANVEVIEPLGSETLTWLNVGGKSMTGRFPPELGARPGERCARHARHVAHAPLRHRDRRGDRPLGAPPNQRGAGCAPDFAPDRRVLASIQGRIKNDET
jgi:hypothetical protein